MSRMLEEQIENLKREFTTMGLNVSASLKNGLEAMKNYDPDLIKDVQNNDETINEQETHIEKISAQIIALQQPVASDLRLIISILKASSDLERLGDHATSFVKHIRRAFSEDPRDEEVEKLILEMGNNINTMLDKIMKAYVNLDKKTALEIVEEDLKNDEHYHKIRHKLIKGIQGDTEFTRSGIDYLNIAKHLERMGDYIINISEWIVYAKDGKITELGNKDDA